MGFCLSGENERFTLDEAAVRVVVDSFVDLYDRKLVYRAEKLVNWDTELQTAISDIEIAHRTVDGQLYHVDYVNAADPAVKLTVSTTRPETMFGDVCLVVHPDDARYSKHCGS